MNLHQIDDGLKILGYDFRVYGTWEDPLFLAKDVAEWIGYDVTSVHKLLKNVDDHEKTTRNLSPSGSEYKTIAWFVTEDGVHEILMQSRKPIARQFKAEVKRILHEHRMKCASAPFRVKFDDEALRRLSKETLALVAKESWSYAEKADHVIDQQKAEIKLLSKEELTWADRDFIIAAVKRFGHYTYFSVTPTEKMQYAWGRFYKALAYRYHISIRSRSIDNVTGKKANSKTPVMNLLRDDEIPKAVATIVALCNEKGIDLSDILCRLQDPSIAYDPDYIDENPVRIYRMDENGIYVQVDDVSTLN